MPHYHFHVADTADFRDEDGIELPDLDAARRMGLSYLSEALRDAARRPNLPRDLHLEVTNDFGLVLFSVATIVADAPIVRKQVSA